jgi:hypothetical protein
MKEAFEVMGSHPFLTMFLGGIFIVSLAILGDVLITLINKIPSRKK